jgi:hypothetical protein
MKCLICFENGLRNKTSEFFENSEVLFASGVVVPPQGMSFRLYDDQPLLAATGK